MSAIIKHPALESEVRMSLARRAFAYLAKMMRFNGRRLRVGQAIARQRWVATGNGDKVSVDGPISRRLRRATCRAAGIAFEPEYSRRVAT